nr:hypothetical protein [Anaerolineae bacterium]
MQATKDRLGERWWVVVVLIGLAAVMVAGSTALFLPVGPDFKDVYRPAARELLITGNPFRNEGFFNAPWGLLPLVPLAFLPERIGWGIFVTAGLVSF